MKENPAFDEMMVHIPLCTHKDTKNVLIIGTASKGLKTEVLKHTRNVEFGNITILSSKNEKNIDVIILTDVNLDKMVLTNIQRILKDDGLVTFPTSSFSKDKEKLKSDLKLIGRNFWIAMPFNFGDETAILASKKYHPTADIVLQKSDLLNNLEYYSSQIQLASFVFPAAQHKELTEIAKR